jgi:hypothetical protein
VSSARPPLVTRRAVRAGVAAGLAGLGLSLAAGTAVATDYELNPWVSLGAGYNDNVTLAPSSVSEISGADGIVDARADFLAREGNWQWLFRPEARGTWYPSHSDVDSNGEFLNLSAQYTGQRSTLILQAYGQSQSLLTESYLPTATIVSGLGTAEPGTTVGAPTSLRQNLGTLTPSYTLQMTPRTSLQLTGTYTDASYDRTVVGWDGYEDATGAGGLVFAVNPTDSLTLRATGADFRPDQGGRTADTYGPEVEWDGNYSQTKQYYLRAGVDRTDFSGSLAGVPEASSDSTTWSGGAGTHWTYQVTEIFVDATRSIAPTPQGYAVIQDQLRLRLARRFTPRLAGFVGARAIYEEPLRGGIASTTRVPAQHYNYGTTGFEWRIRRQISVVAAYSITEYHYTAAPAQANQIQLSVVYEPNRPAEGPAITTSY